MAPENGDTVVNDNDGGDMKVADLVMIKYEKLLCADFEESQRLFHACKDWGFFYLDLSGCKEFQYQDTVRSMFDMSRQYFTKSLEEKLRDTNEEFSLFNICGYKPMRLDSGNVRERKDGCEGMRIPIDLVLNPGKDPRLHRPQGIQGHWQLVERYIQQSYDASLLILKRLSDALDIQGSSRYENYHRADRLSTSTAVMQYYPLDLPDDTSVGHFTHTDTGSITILFNTEWGLQVCSPNTDKWEYVEPKHDQAIVNVGDSLKFLSNLNLKSCLHRVVPCPSKWKSGARMACIFFLRPNHDAEVTDTEGNRYKAVDWLNRKFGNYRASHSVQQGSAIATGRKGFLGLWDGETTPDRGHNDKFTDLNDGSDNGRHGL